VQRAWLGVTIAAVDDDIAKSLDLAHVEGVILKSIVKGGAAQSKLTKGDVITKLNNIPVNSPAEFNGVLAVYRPGEYINIDYIRNKKLYNAEVLLHNHLNTTELISIRKDKVLKDIGIEIRDLSLQESISLGKHGVKVISVQRGSPTSIALPCYALTS